MKFKKVLLTLTLALLFAAVHAQTVTMKVTNTPLEKVFTDVETQTGFNIVANYDIIRSAKPVTASATSMPLEKFLAMVLKEQQLDFFIRSKTITITRKPVSNQKINTTPAAEMAMVSGVVTDSAGRPLPGATVAVQGKGGNVPADADGRFQVKAVTGDQLLISFVGYNPVQLKVADASTLIYVVLRPAVSQLNEYVVEVNTGYQKLKKTQLTGAFAVLDRKSYLQSVPVTGNIVENMEGRIAGLMLKTNQSNNYDPSNTSPFTIRGVSTFQAIKKPLIVLNGYPTEINIDALNPYDIESITVLKDAAAAAIYGVRASNGVIVINTRKGTNSKPQFHLNVAYTYRPKPDFNKLGLAKGKSFVDFEMAYARDYYIASGMDKDYFDMVNGTYTPVFSIADDLYYGRITQAEADKQLQPYIDYDNTADYKRLFMQNQQFRTVDFSMNGGADKSNYFLGVNRVDNMRSSKYSDFGKTTFNYKGAYDFMKIFTLDVQSIYAHMKDESVPVPDYTSFRPYQHFRDASGNALRTYLNPWNDAYFGFDSQWGTISPERNAANQAMGLYDGYYYPYQEMFESKNTIQSDIFRLQGNVRAKITPALHFELGGVYEKELGTTTNYASENAYQTRLMLNYYADRDPLTDKPIFRFPQGGVNKTTERQTTTYTARAQLTYNKMFGDLHDVSLLAGTEVRRLTTNSRLNTTFGYDNNTLSMKPADLSLIGNRMIFPAYADELAQFGSYLDDYTSFSDFFHESYYDDRFVSWYANGAYTYDNRYSITGSLRIDQSNLFGSDPKFRYTPLWSTGFSWNAQNEAFLRDATWLNELKLRLSAGYNGNIIKLSGPYTILAPSLNNYIPNATIGYAVSTLSNNQLRWEKTLNYNIGVDMAVLERRVSASIDYYIKRGQDIFSSLQVDPTKGFNNALLNNATIENRGLDIAVNTVNVKSGNFKWQTQITGSFNNSKVLQVANQYAGSNNFTRVTYPSNVVGYPISAVLAHNYLGLNEYGQPTVKGDDGKPLVLSFTPLQDVSFSNLRYMGVNDPRYALGLNNQFTVHDFSLNFLLMYYGGNIARITPPSIYSDRPLSGIENYWKQPGDEQHTDIPGFSAPYGDPGYFTTRTGYEYAAKFFRKMDFIALRNVTLTWDVNPKLAKKVHLIQPKLILQVQNPYKYVFSGNDVDPETLDYTSGRRGLPVVPSYTVSLNLNF
ncbi:TonB-linked SusC/RagA family outer membrane protein [Chitinophaga dinghuensis]|uniref:TonB-linked SusC/RagA family outer membrane protein n=1 Tax=Chitinophaga dinghuensis TaxID=1539050 RepID=A0A327W0V1_9BACT|nr:SusC/RagA family TonB-linked outer membrane protein [Chitinophaga dinghuensis]RAJ81865.1 TonB-linked SusC/RagA family outer membrane protein [Chitinophaga dinghuensis]